MSAFLVSDNHLHAICSFASGLKCKGYGLPSHGDLFALFKNANLIALKDRYGDEFVPAKARVKLVAVPAVEVVKACHSLEYQCSDWSNWNGSPEEKALAAICKAAVMALPGYEEAAWAIV